MKRALSLLLALLIILSMAACGRAQNPAEKPGNPPITEPSADASVPPANTPELDPSAETVSDSNETDTPEAALPAGNADEPNPDSSADEPTTDEGIEEPTFFRDGGPGGWTSDRGGGMVIGAERAETVSIQIGVDGYGIVDDFTYTAYGVGWDVFQDGDTIYLSPLAGEYGTTSLTVTTHGMTGTIAFTLLDPNGPPAKPRS